MWWFGVHSAGRVALCALSLVCLLVAGCDRGDRGSRWNLETMGTVGEVQIYGVGEPSAAEGMTKIKAVFDSVESLMSTWDPDSEISRLNRAPTGEPLALSNWLNECLSYAEDMRAASWGAFDPTAEPLMRLWGFYRKEGILPSRAEIDSARALMGRYRHDRAAGSVLKEKRGTSFDLGGIAKGYALDRAAEGLLSNGIENFLIDLGGNLLCMGAPPDRETWRVGIRDPRDRTGVFARVDVSGGAVATSGSYERYVEIEGRRYGHIMNPSTGTPAEGLLSVTVLAPTATLADGLSTSLFVLGLDRGRALIEDSFHDVEYVFVTAPEGTKPPLVVASAGLEGSFVLLGDSGENYRVDFR